MAVASVIIPAYNEAATIGRNLSVLRTGTQAEDLEVVVVCNGCTDATAEVARRADPRALVMEIAQPSKAEAVRLGNTATDVFPRVHLDADIELTGTALFQLLKPITRDQVLATAPRREVPRLGCSLLVRWYYDVWEALPQVESGLFGRGVVALSEQAQERVTALPHLLNDDLAMSDAFTSEERRIVSTAVAVVHPPRTLRDLLRRRIRIATGNSQATDLGVRRPASQTSIRTLLTLATTRPGIAVRIPLFVAVHLAARIGARRAVRSGDFTTWHRDESSRS